MSTFNGFVKEFPLIRIDRFRPLPGCPPPLACFLSHVHSDHLVGLETLKCPFVYCSLPTRQVLLRLERYSSRVNFDKGILESRKQTYKHLRLLLKPLPLETPTQIELAPGNEIQVTLFDANHCVGSVMFLVEGQGQAILYTGDIRAEAWWVNSLARHPILLPYCSGMKKLQKIYLDTTFALKSNPYREFPPKAEGLRELLQKVGRYPEDTNFYFKSWTFGYEEVWLALAHMLRSYIHVDRYRHSLYLSLKNNDAASVSSSEAAQLAGFKCGNVVQNSILTDDKAVKLHSCECEPTCTVFEKRPVVIIPIVSRHGGEEIAEAGAGGGKGDLSHIHELDIPDRNTLRAVFSKIRDKADKQGLLSTIESLFLKLAEDQRQTLVFNPSKIHPGLEEGGETSKLEELSAILKTLSAPAEVVDENGFLETKADRGSDELPRQIRFPYSRHSSYSELRHLVSMFKPKDVYPCVARSAEAWTEEFSIRSLFGDACSNDEAEFDHDIDMRQQIRKLTLSEECDRTNCDNTPSHETRKSTSREESLSAGRPTSGPCSHEVKGGNPSYENQTAENPITKSCHVPPPHVNQKEPVPDGVNLPRRLSLRPSSSAPPRLSANERLGMRYNAYDAAISGNWASRVCIRSVQQAATARPPSPRKRTRRDIEIEEEL